MRILIAEDDPMIGASLVRGLTDEGYSVDWVRDGTHAESALQDPLNHFQLALLDWGLPHKSGIDVLRALRLRGDNIPVLILTARDALRDRVEGLDLGADDFLVKPFEFAELKARTRNISELYGILAEEIKRRTTAEWQKLLDAADLPNGAVNDLGTMAENPYLEATGFFHHYEHPSEGAMVTTAIPVQFGNTPGSIRLAPPRLGEHTKSVLQEIGYGDADIGEIR